MAFSRLTRMIGMLSSYARQPSWAAGVALGVVLGLAAACGSDGPTSACVPIGLSPVKSVAISATTPTIKVGLTTQLTATATLAGPSCPATDIAWSSSNPAVASVTSSGTNGTIG